MSGIHAPMASTVVAVLVAPGEPVRTGQVLLILEAMKMEHEIRAVAAGEVLAVLARGGRAGRERRSAGAARSRAHDGDNALAERTVPTAERSDALRADLQRDARPRTR